VLEALRSVQVTTATDGPSVFQLTFELEQALAAAHDLPVAGGATPPLVRVVIAVTVNGVTEVLMDGVMTNHEVTGGGSGRTRRSP
jgi:hypothetical protein